MSQAESPSGLCRTVSTMPMIPMMATGADAGDDADDGDDDDSDDDDAGDATDGNDDVSNSNAGGEDDYGAAGDHGGLLAIRQPTYRSDWRLPWQRGGHIHVRNVSIGCILFKFVQYRGSFSLSIVVSLSQFWNVP